MEKNCDKFPIWRGRADKTDNIKVKLSETVIARCDKKIIEKNECENDVSIFWSARLRVTAFAISIVKALARRPPSFGPVHAYTQVSLPDEQLFLIIHPPGHHSGSCKMENYNQRVSFDRESRLRDRYTELEHRELADG